MYIFMRIFCFLMDDSTMYCIRFFLLFIKKIKKHLNYVQKSPEPDGVVRPLKTNINNTS